MSTNPGEFAFGSDEVPDSDECLWPCPAVQAGYSPITGDRSMEVAEWYDKFAEDLTGVMEGTLPEDQAKKFWKEAVKEVEARFGENSKEAEAARDIEQQLGWNS